MDIVALFQCLQPYVPSTTRRQLSRIALALLVMTGRVTMLGISRWAGKGGSYRTVQRFFSTVIPWATLLWVFFRQHLYRPEDVYLLAGDEVVAPKAGKHTHGRDRFFASLYGKPVPGLAFFTLSRFLCASSRWSAATRRKRPARPKRTPRSGNRPPPSAVPGVPRAARTPPKPPCPSRQSYSASQASWTPCCTWSPGLSH